MFFTSTRLILMPQGSVASSSTMRILVLMCSLLVRDSSSSSSPMIFLRVVAVRFSDGVHRAFHTIGIEFRIGYLEINYRVYLHGHIIFGDDWLRRKVYDFFP